MTPVATSHQPRHQSALTHCCSVQNQWAESSLQCFWSERVEKKSPKDTHVLIDRTAYVSGIGSILIIKHQCYPRRTVTNTCFLFLQAVSSDFIKTILCAQTDNERVNLWSILYINKTSTSVRPHLVEFGIWIWTEICGIVHSEADA